MFDLVTGFASPSVTCLKTNTYLLDLTKYIASISQFDFKLIYITCQTYVGTL